MHFLAKVSNFRDADAIGEGHVDLFHSLPQHGFSQVRLEIKLAPNLMTS